jgi:molybdate transport system regulatory protein
MKPTSQKIVKRASLIRFRIDFAENCNVGPGKIALLDEIRKCGSLSQAARRMKLSYRRAWLLIDSLNRSFDVPATVNKTGGTRGGGAEVTPFGVLLIERYREAEQKLNDAAGECLEEIRRHVKRNAPGPARRTPLSKRRAKRL